MSPKKPEMFEMPVPGSRAPGVPDCGACMTFKEMKEDPEGLAFAYLVGACEMDQVGKERLFATLCSGHRVFATTFLDAIKKRVVSG